jgi:hypothetical protein
VEAIGDIPVSAKVMEEKDRAYDYEVKGGWAGWSASKC